MAQLNKENQRLINILLKIIIGTIIGTFILIILGILMVMFSEPAKNSQMITSFHNNFTTSLTI